MIVEDLYGIDLLNPCQLHIYRAVADLLKPVSTHVLDFAQTCSQVKQALGYHELEMRIVPVDNRAFPVRINMLPESAMLSFGGWHEIFSAHANREFNGDEIAVQIVATVAHAFQGGVKVVEHQSNRRGFKWERFDFFDGRWQLHSLTTVFLYNYFGEKTTVERFCRLY